MRPKLEVYCDGALIYSDVDPRIDDTHTLFLVFSVDGEPRYFPWPVGDNGQLVNPWMTSLDFLHGVNGSKSPVGRPETWHDRPSLI